MSAQNLMAIQLTASTKVVTNQPTNIAIHDMLCRESFDFTWFSVGLEKIQGIQKSILNSFVK